MAPMRSRSGYVFQHRLVFGRNLNRPLEAYETVHHIDGNRSNNTLENLQLRIGKHGAGQAYQCQDCGSCNVQPTKLAEGVN